MVQLDSAVTLHPPEGFERQFGVPSFFFMETSHQILILCIPPPKYQPRMSLYEQFYQMPDVWAILVHKDLHQIYIPPQFFHWPGGQKNSAAGMFSKDHPQKFWGCRGRESQYLAFFNTHQCLDFCPPICPPKYPPRMTLCQPVFNWQFWRYPLTCLQQCTMRVSAKSAGPVYNGHFEVLTLSPLFWLDSGWTLLDLTYSECQIFGSGTAGIVWQLSGACLLDWWVQQTFWPDFQWNFTKPAVKFLRKWPDGSGKFNRQQQKVQWKSSGLQQTAFLISIINKK